MQVSQSRRWIVDLALAGMVLLASPARAQWTTGSGGTIYYNGGQVGIGTTAPAWLLHLNAAGDQSVTLTTSGGAWFISNGAAGHWNGSVVRVGQTNRWFYGADNRAESGGDAGSNFIINPFTDTGLGQSPALTILRSNSYVGIGTVNPQYRLAVNGTIGAKDIIVTNTGWSDYVFRPTYRLRSLSEVNAYIQKHHHLPDIPTASEVKQKGVNVGEMQAKLLAKVEELTLHMIQQDKENQALRERLAWLEQATAKSLPVTEK